jgi:hypothetical protein
VLQSAFNFFVGQQQHQSISDKTSSTVISESEGLKPYSENVPNIVTVVTEVAVGENPRIPHPSKSAHMSDAADPSALSEPSQSQNVEAASEPISDSIRELI